MKNTKIILFLLCVLSSISVWGQGQYCDEADELFKQGKYYEARNKYILCWKYDSTANETIILLQKKKAEDCDTWQKQGENYINQKKWKNAFGYFDKIVGINPDDKKAINRLSLCIEKGDIPNVEIVTVYKTDTIIKTEKEIVVVRDTTFIVVRDTTIIVPTTNNTLNFLPFGVHQFANKQTGKGILFAGTQAGLLGTSIGYRISANNNFNKHKNDKYEQWERDRFYGKYENHLRKSGWFLAGAAVMIGLNYCDNFNWFRKNNLAVVPAPIFDLQGKPQMAMTLNVKF